jgi:hypothetical protein
MGKEASDQALKCALRSRTALGLDVRASVLASGPLIASPGNWGVGTKSAPRDSIKRPTPGSGSRPSMHLGRNQLFYGDNRIPSSSVDLVYLEPPHSASAD